jgi:hypothetical protein
MEAPQKETDNNRKIKIIDFTRFILVVKIA